MVEVDTGPSPTPAALISRFDLPLGFEAARVLAANGYRLVLLHPDAGAGREQRGELPSGVCEHEVIQIDPDEPTSYGAALAEAELRLGSLTAVVHVAASDGPEPGDDFSPSGFERAIGQGAGALLSLGLRALPGMLGTQTGTICALFPAAAAGQPLEGAGVGDAASVGALLGAVRELARHCEGSPLRVLLLCAPPGGAEGRAWSDEQAREFSDQLGEAGDLPTGHFGELCVPASRLEIRLLEPPVLPPPAPSSPPASGVASVGEAEAMDRLSETLAATFRAAFGLAADAQVVECEVGSVTRWDSLGHLKLMMEVEQALGVRLPADALSRIQSYRDLEDAVRATLPDF